MNPENGMLHLELRTDFRAVFYEAFCEHNGLTCVQDKTVNGITRVTVRTWRKEEYAAIYRKKKTRL